MEDDLKIAKLTFEAGFLLRRSIRNLLERLEFEGLSIQWLEQKGFISSTFIIKGSNVDIERIYDIVKQFEEDW